MDEARKQQIRDFAIAHSGILGVLIGCAALVAGGWRPFAYAAMGVAVGYLAAAQWAARKRMRVNRLLMMGRIRVMQLLDAAEGADPSSSKHLKERVDEWLDRSEPREWL